ncbi:unnamed protein product, partial [marine sediment metagenome]
QQLGLRLLKNGQINLCNKTLQLFAVSAENGLQLGVAELLYIDLSHITLCGEVEKINFSGCDIRNVLVNEDVPTHLINCQFNGANLSHGSLRKVRALTDCFFNAAMLTNIQMPMGKISGLSAIDAFAHRSCWDGVKLTDNVEWRGIKLHDASLCDFAAPSGLDWGDANLESTKFKRVVIAGNLLSRVYGLTSQQLIADNNVNINYCELPFKLEDELTQLGNDIGKLKFPKPDGKDNAKIIEQCLLNSSVNELQPATWQLLRDANWQPLSGASSLTNLQSPRKVKLEKAHPLF